MSRTNAPQHDHLSEAREDLVVVAMLGAVGALGIAVGLIGDRATDLALGLLLVIFTLKVVLDERRARRTQSY